MTNITATEPPEREWLIQGALPRNVAAVLIGQGGCGKSIAVLDMCIKIATRDFYGELGKPPETFLGPVAWGAQGPAVFITLEDDRNELHRRALSLDPERVHAERDRGIYPVKVLLGVEELDFNPALITSAADRIAKLTTYAEVGLPRMMERVKKQCGMYPRLLVLDPIGDFLEGPEDDASLVQPLMLYFRRLAEEYGCTILLVGHTPKSKLNPADPLGSLSVRGSGAFIFNSRFSWGLYRPIPATSITFLKEIGVDPTAANIARVVFGGRVKENQPGERHGERKYLQEKDTGLLIDMTTHIRVDKVDMRRTYALLIHAIRVGALVDMPFTAAELKSRVDALPLGLELPGKTKLAEWITYLKAQQLIKSCRITGESHKFLDVPGGPYASGKRASEDRLTGEFPDNAYELHPFKEGADNGE